MISATDSRVLDANSEALGVPVALLMDNAGAAVADFLESRYPDKRILFVCGPGNNGGDGFAAALRMDPSRVKVSLLKKASQIHTDIARERYSVLECDISMYSEDCIDQTDIIVDCALGTGISGTVRDPYRQFIIDANNSGKTIVSVDIPSGLGTDIAIRPTHTITFHDIKNGMDPSNCGEIIIADIGIPEEASTIIGPGDMMRYPLPGKDSHKGQNGRLMVIAGGPYFGAPIMASMAALRVGTDIVRVFTPESSATVISLSSPVLMVTSIQGDHLTSASVPMLLKESEHYDAVLIGPGIGIHQETVDAVRMFVSDCRTPMVVDADGITAVAGMILPEDTIVTPHSGEYMRLNADGVDQQDLSAKIHAIILRKGREDVVTDGEHIRTNITGTPAMTGAGTGDVLSGTVAGLLSKGMRPFDAACVGAFISGKAGEIAFDEKSYGLIATDVIENIPSVLKTYLR
ncbi:MAG: NAD(P)H-hydrate dehydratase [Candidatus Methanomethylophilaceae archaeon]